MSEWVFIGAAYGLTWVMFAAYGLYVRARLSRARSAYAQLQQNRGDVS